jgi:threonine synthase
MSPGSLIERYRDRLPLEEGDPVVTLNEGSTPLIEAERLSERIGARTLLKFEGANPTGSFKDRGMTVAVSHAKARGAEAIICASTGNTAASAAAYAARAGLRGAVIVPEGKIAIGKLAQALMHGARVVALQGNFDEALQIVRELAQKHPIELVNSVNPYRIEGQKTAAFEVIEELGEAPGALAIPVGNAGNVTAYWRGFQEMGASPLLYGFQAEGAAPLVHGEAVENPETVASAIRIGNPARWEEARRRGQRRADPRRLSLARGQRGRLLRARLGGLGRRSARARDAGGRGRGAADGRLRPHRPRAEGPGHGTLESSARRQLRERPRRGRARGVRMSAERGSVHLRFLATERSARDIR